MGLWGGDRHSRSLCYRNWKWIKRQHQRFFSFWRTWCHCAINVAYHAGNIVSISDTSIDFYRTYRCCWESVCPSCLCKGLCFTCILGQVAGPSCFVVRSKIKCFSKVIPFKLFSSVTDLIARASGAEQDHVFIHRRCWWKNSRACWVLCGLFWTNSSNYDYFSL